MKRILLLSMMVSSVIAAPAQSTLKIVNEFIDLSSNIQRNKALNNLRKEVRTEAKAVEGSIDDHISKLQALKYRVDRMQEASDKVLRQILVIDHRLSNYRDSLISQISNLKNVSLIDSAMEDYRSPYKQRDGYDDKILALNQYVHQSQLDGIRQSYFMQFDNQTVEHYLKHLANCLASEDSIVSRMELLLNHKNQALAKRRQEEARQEEIRQEELKQNEAMLRERQEQWDREVQESKQKEDNDAAKEALIRSKLPSKDGVEAKYRSYTHKTGHVFEMFPIGFVPAKNVGVNDYVTIWGTKYKARYRETDPSGQINTLIIDFYDSGNVKEVKVYDAITMIYNAQYADAASKPYEVRAQTVDHKYYSVLKREYDYDLGRVVKTFKYQDESSGIWVE